MNYPLRFLKPLLMLLANLSFFGYNLERLSFKRVFYQGTKLCRYSDEENALRLRRCFKGEASEAVKRLVVANSSGETIMRSLVLQFGKPEDVVLSLVNSIRTLPKLSSGKFNIVSSTSVIKDNVDAITYLKKTGYLHNIELIREVLSK